MKGYTLPYTLLLVFVMSITVEGCQETGEIKVNSTGDSLSLITFFSVLSIHLNQVKLYFCSSKWSSIGHFIWFNLIIKSGGIIRFSFKFLTQVLCSSENFVFHYLGWNIIDFFLFVMLRLISGLRFNLTQS